MGSRQDGKNITKAARGVSFAVANKKIDTLRRRAAANPVAVRSGREYLDRPLDGRIQITTKAATHRISLMVDQVDVSGTLVFDFKQHFGPCRLRMGGVAGVRTHRDHRFRGYSRIVLENMLRWMRGEGFDVSMLYGITGFYPKFGYVPAFPETHFECAVRDAERLPSSGCTFVDYNSSYLSAVLKVFRRNQATRTGPTERDRRYWKPFREGISWGPQAVCRVALDKERQVAGYFVYDAGREDIYVLEVGHAHPGVFADIFGAVARMAWQRRLASIRFRLPDDDQLMAYGQSQGLALKKEVSYLTDGGPMVRIINGCNALAKAAPLLASRMQRSGRLCLDTNIDRIWLAWSGGEMTVGTTPLAGATRARLGQGALASLLYGYTPASGLAAAGTLKTSAKGLEMLSQLFPVTPHYHSRVDAF
ncbi:MAG: GNAT family N-acetyltransferase [Candidatus Latescibacteria bacterium]|nr:GNAT family N-acetyltransferase [Candidatus Latescibacterota bacterium]